MPANRSLTTLLPWIAAVTGGILFFLGYAGFDRFYLEWISLVPVLWAVRGQRPGRAFLLGWVAGTVGHAGGFYWVVGMFQLFAGLPSIKDGQFASWPAAASSEDRSLLTAWGSQRCSWTH